jgi:alkanesulfonate monooxygenase SsuD/methylene tetrahydromethanopterin reductase-like flavin-dependent oxidoreductase (luciferase family)
VLLPGVLETTDEALAVLRALLRGEQMPQQPRYYPGAAGVELTPGPRRPGGIPLWIGSWGSGAGLARVATAGDGWLASAYNTTPERFSAARVALARALEDRGREAACFPNALAAMWTWVSKDRAEGDRVLADVLAPVLRRDPDELRTHVCVGPAQHCAELLSRYAEAGCERVYLWPLGDEARQLELVASAVAPQIRPCRGPRRSRGSSTRSTSTADTAMPAASTNPSVPYPVSAISAPPTAAPNR